MVLIVCSLPGERTTPAGSLSVSVSRPDLFTGPERNLCATSSAGLLPYNFHDPGVHLGSSLRLNNELIISSADLLNSPLSFFLEQVP